MKWLAFFLLFIQATWISSCVLDKVENMGGELYSITQADLNQCFVKCYKDKNCTGLLHIKAENLCHLNRECHPPTPYSCTGRAVCYILQRDEVDSMCQRYLYF